MTGLTVPTQVTQNIARAKSLLRRDDPIRALESLMTGIDLYEPSKLLGKARFEATVLIEECIQELNRQKQVKDFLQSVSKSEKASIAYAPGEEGKLKPMLLIIHKALKEIDASKLRQAEEERQQRKEHLRQKGLTYLQNDDGPRGKAALRVLADEYGTERGILVDIGGYLEKAGFLFDALEFYLQSIELFPKESKAYTGAANCAMTLREAEVAVDVYTKALKNFGKHPITMLNLAKAYLMANNRDKAFEYALAAAKADPTNEEARELADRLS